MSKYENPLRTPGNYVQLEAVEWLPEAANHNDPETLLIAAQEHAEIERGELAIARLAREDERAAVAYTMTSLHRPPSIAFLAGTLRTTPDDAERIVSHARARYAEILAELVAQARAR